MRLRSTLTALTAAAAVLAISPSSAAAAPSVKGDWLTADGSRKIRIVSCGETLCGTIIWLKQGDQAVGQPRLDVNNPDPALRNRAVLGLQVITGFKPTSAGWAGGAIYDPNTGKTYAAKLSANPDGALRVEGCIAVFCQSRTWTPVK